MSSLEGRIDAIEGWLAGQGIDVRQLDPNPPPPAAEEGAEPEPPKELTVEERVARLELAATTNGFNLAAA